MSAAPVDRWQPRYLAYCKSRGLSPQRVLDLDRMRWPGGCMAGYLLWIAERWAAWERERGGPVWGRKSSEERKDDLQHSDFDRWLTGKLPPTVRRRAP